MDDTIEVFGDKGQTYAACSWATRFRLLETGFGYASKRRRRPRLDVSVFEEHWNYAFPRRCALRALRARKESRSRWRNRTSVQAALYAAYASREWVGKSCCPSTPQASRSPSILEEAALAGPCPDSRAPAPDQLKPDMLISNYLGHQVRVQVRTHWIKVYPELRAP